MRAWPIVQMVWNLSSNGAEKQEELGRWGGVHGEISKPVTLRARRFSCTFPSSVSNDLQSPSLRIELATLLVSVYEVSLPCCGAWLWAETRHRPSCRLVPYRSIFAADRRGVSALNDQPRWNTSKGRKDLAAPRMIEIAPAPLTRLSNYFGGTTA